MDGMARGTWVPLAILLVALAARAGADEGPCAADTSRWCTGRAPADLISCLQSHRADLSSSCVDYLEYAMVSIEAILQDCQPDAFQLCRNVGRGEPTATCLSRNQGKLTRRCQDDFDSLARAEAVAAKDCAADAARSCGGVKPGNGDVYICLLYKGKDLSPACRKAMVR